MTVIGIILGLIVAGGIASIVTITILTKSNEFGNKEADIEQYTGYNPINVENVGQVNLSGSSNMFY